MIWTYKIQALLTLKYIRDCIINSAKKIIIWHVIADKDSVCPVSFIPVVH